MRRTTTAALTVALAASAAGTTGATPAISPPASRPCYETESAGRDALEAADVGDASALRVALHGAVFLKRGTRLDLLALKTWTFGSSTRVRVLSRPHECRACWLVVHGAAPIERAPAP
jgi:hypothetical protein